MRPELARGAVLIGQPRRVGLLICRMVYGNREHPSVGTWLARTVHWFLASPFFGAMHEIPVNKAPVYAARNFAAETALKMGADYLLMCDADSVPDVVPQAPPFFETAMAFAQKHPGPCVVSAPVPMVNGCVNVHREITDDGGRRHLELVPLPEVAGKAGFERVPACGAGLLLIDVRCFARLEKPYFGFAYADESCSDVAAGEDVGFTARLTDKEIPVFAAWDSWCGHDKSVLFGRPGGPGAVSGG